jgi:predicted RNA-binding protein Jag
MTLANMPMPEKTLEKDVLHYIEDMTTYLDHYHQLNESQIAKLVKTGVKGEARDVLIGHAGKQLNATGKIYKILKNKFKRREKSAKNLHQLKQEQTEKVSIFAGRIRKYVRGKGVTDLKFDHNCIEFMKVGTLPRIQSQLYLRNPRTFARAIRN